MRALLAEDDAILADALGTNLKSAGFEVEVADNGAVAEYLLTKQAFDVGIIDIGLPLVDGLTVVQRVRAAKPGLPLLILTALDGLHNRVAGLNAGADDYLLKPFDLDELIARIRAVVRRSHHTGTPWLECGALRLDPEQKTVTLHGEPVALSAREFAVLETLMQRPGTVISRSQLEDSLYGWEHEIGSNAIEVHLHHLRRKLGAHVIGNVRGLGYKVLPP